MSDRFLQRINLISFVVALATIVLGVFFSVIGVWDAVPRLNTVIWKILATDGIVFAGAVLTNLAIACYRKPGSEAA